MKNQPYRHKIQAHLRTETCFDLVVIGGGATGCGIALDAASRGLKVALFDKHDLAEGTSSRSTKLVHGGVRYLEAAIKKRDKGQYHLVKEALYERGLFLKNAPHLAHRRAFVTPIYRWLDVPYLYMGLTLYDLLAGKKGLGRSVLLWKKEALRRFPMLKADALKAGVVYYDGQFNDARMVVALARTAEAHGALIANHLMVTALHNEAGKISGIQVQAQDTGLSFSIKTKGVINATGPFVDAIRKMDDAHAPAILEASSGIHIALPKRFAPSETGLLIPKTEDGRVLFILPWQGHALVGTTDTPSPIEDHPQAKEAEIDYLLRHINCHFNTHVTRSDVQSVWSGLRPLVKTPSTHDTAEIVREHLILESRSGLLTIAGGKWTSYRRMAEEVVDKAITSFHFDHASPCQTETLSLLGGAQYSPHAYRTLMAQFGFPEDIAQHLNSAYGDQAGFVGALAQEQYSERLHPLHPFIEAEVIYAVRYDYALHAIDVLARRLPLALLDLKASTESLPRIVEIMGQENHWSEAVCQQEMALATRYLQEAL